MNYKRIYLAFFGIIIGLIVFSQILIQTHLRNQKSFTNIINHAGKQRNNSLFIIRYCYRTQRDDLQHLIPGERMLLYKLINKFEKIHLGLQYGDEELQLPGNNSAAIKKLFEEITPIYKVIVSGARQIACDELDPPAQSVTYERIVSNMNPFIETLDKITTQYDQEAEQKLRHLQYYELLIALLTIFTIILEVVLIIKPVLNYYYKKSSSLALYNEELEKKNRKIQKQNDQLNYYNEELSKAKEDAELAMMEKAMFLSNMSHEIRTPMNAVLGITNLMIEDEPKPDQLDNLKTLKFSAENLLTILNDILDFNKIEAGKIKIEAISFYPKEIVENISRSLAPQLKKKQLPLKVSLDKRLPEGLIGDPVRLSQILFNLLGNAMKFTDHGQLELNVRLQKIENNEASLLFEVKDTGIGIPKEKLTDIFEDFTQASSDTNRLYGGTGLGLAICKKLVEFQGGEIGVHSKIGKGSTFYFTLTFPISFEKVAKNKPSHPDKQEHCFNNDQKILVVEDNRINQMVITKFLKKWSVNFDIVDNGKIGVQKVEENDYSLVLMDLQMPVMDGYEATLKIRTMDNGRYGELPIIALSASAMLEIRERAFQVGMNEYVCKPFKPDDLYYAMAKYMN